MEVQPIRECEDSPSRTSTLEEFLVSTGKKEKISISLKKKKEEFYEVLGVQRVLYNYESGWGHLGLMWRRRRISRDREKGNYRGGLYGSFYELDYLIRKEKLGRGIQYGEIHIRSPYTELRYPLHLGQAKPR